MNWGNVVTAVVVFLAIAGLMGLICAVGAHYFSVKTDERIETVNSLLPGYNCGACGKPGCSVCRRYC